MADPKNGQDELMPLPSIKRMLGIAEGTPLGCAFGLTKDKKECLLLIAKGVGSKIAARLRVEGKALSLEPGSVRFGKVDFDIERDPGTVRFTVNHSEVGGTIMAMTRLAKKAGYHGIVINVDPELENEDGAAGDMAAEDAASDAGTVPPAPPSMPPPTGTTIDAQALKTRLTGLVQRMIARIAAEPALKDELTALAKQAQVRLGTNNLQTATELTDALEALLAKPAAPGAGHADAGHADAGHADAGHADAGLTTRLTELVKRLSVRVAVDPGAKDALTGLAHDAQALLRAGDPAGATAKVDALEAMLASPLPTGDAETPGVPKGAFVKMQTSRLIWMQARSKVAAEIGAYVRSVEEAFEGDDDEEDVLDALEELDGILLNLDDRLTDTLDDLLDERTTPKAYEKLLAEAKSLLAEYEDYVSSSPLISRLDGPTPFGVTLTVGSTLTKTLQGLRTALH